MTEEVDIPDDGGAPLPDEPEPSEPGSPPEPDEPVVTDEPDDTPEEDPQFQKFLDKHQGNRAAAAKHYFDVMSQNARFHEDNERLQQRVRDLESARRGPEREPEPDPSLVQLDKQIATLQKDIDALPAEENGIVKSYQDAQGRDAYLSHRIEEVKADTEMDADQRRQIVRTLEGQREAIQARLEAIATRYQLFRSRSESRLSDMAALTQARQDAEGRIYRSRVEERELAAQREQFNVDFPQYIDGLTDAAAKEAGIEIDDYVRREIINAQLIRVVAPYNRQNQAADTIDWPAHVRKVVGDYKAHVDRTIRARLARPRSPAPGAPTRSPAAQSTPTASRARGGQPESREAIEERIRQNNLRARAILDGNQRRREQAGV